MASPERRRVVESAYAAMPGLKRRARCLAPIGCLHCRCDKGGGLRQAASCLRLRQGGPPMKRHPNARVAPRGREALVSRVRAGERVSDAARQMGAGRQTASKRLARDRLGEGAADRSRRSGGMGAREGEEEGSRPHLLHRPLQLGPPTQRVRGPPSHVAHRRRQQPIGTQQLAWRPPNERHEQTQRVRRAGVAVASGKAVRMPATEWLRCQRSVVRSRVRLRRYC